MVRIQMKWTGEVTRRRVRFANINKLTIKELALPSLEVGDVQEFTPGMP